MPQVVWAELDLKPSVFDRLIDTEPGVSTEPQARRSVHVAQLKASVQRDLEWLLNAKRTPIELPTKLPQLERSPLGYGLPDFSHASLSHAGDKRMLQRAVESAIRRFEPRLGGVTVTLVEGHDSARGIRFRIDALLNVEPAPEPVTFDSLLDLTSKVFVFEPV